MFVCKIASAWTIMKFMRLKSFYNGSNPLLSEHRLAVSSSIQSEINFISSNGDSSNYLQQVRCYSFIIFPQNQPSLLVKLKKRNKSSSWVLFYRRSKSLSDIKVQRNKTNIFIISLKDLGITLYFIRKYSRVAIDMHKKINWFSVDRLYNNVWSMERKVFPIGATNWS